LVQHFAGPSPWLGLDGGATRARAAVSLSPSGSRAGSRGGRCQARRCYPDLPLGRV